MSVLDDAVARLQELALDCVVGDIRIKHAPDYPIEDAAVLPMSIAHLGGGTFQMASDFGKFFPSVYVDFHVNRINLKRAYAELDSLIYQYCLRLAGDPTLDSTIATIVFPVTWSDPAPTQYDQITTLMVRFTVPLKTLETPVTGV